MNTSASRTEFLLRAGLVPVTVGICYLFQWEGLRSLTTLLSVEMTGWVYPEWVRISSDRAAFHGVILHYTVACTLVDAWAGAIPLVWKIKSSLVRNLGYLAALALLVFALNTIRQAGVNLLFSAGLPLKPVHDVLAASAYLLVWIEILRRGAWRENGAIPVRAPAEGFRHVVGACAVRFGARASCATRLYRLARRSKNSACSASRLVRPRGRRTLDFSV